MTPRNERHFKPEYSATLLRIAEGDLESAQALAETQKGRSENVGYHVSQAIEKCLKAVIVHSKMAVPLTHDLGALTEKVKTHFSMELFSDLSHFSEYATFRRYEESSLILEPSDLAAAVDLGRQILHWATEICNRTDL
jgi:HEPN domain-containing protein